MKGEVLKSARLNKGISLREAAGLLETDAAIVSKIENNLRPATRSQLVQMAALYELDARPLLTEWLAHKLLQVLKDEPYAREALLLVSQEMAPAQVDPMERLLREMETLKQMLGKPN